MTLALVSALPEELAGVMLALQAGGASAERVGPRTFHRGALHGQPVVAVLSGIGKVAAATTATLLIERFGASAIVFTGLAGGLGEGVRVGDVVVATELLQHDMNAEPLFPRHEVPGYGRARFAADAALTDRLRAASAKALAGLAPGARVHSGLLLSGDRFVATAAESEALCALLPDALAVEMEGAAFAQVCHDHGVPLAVVRTVSDRADDDAHVDFPRFLREVASRYSEAIFDRVLCG